MDSFGERSSRNMPVHLFSHSLRLDHDSAIQANVKRQNYSVCPRYWYVDAYFRCTRCGREFCFSAAEQKHWYEELKFYVDSHAKDCLICRHDLRRQKELRKRYDASVEQALRSNDIAEKMELIEVLDELVGLDQSLPQKVHENRKLLAIQVARMDRR